MRQELQPKARQQKNMISEAKSLHNGEPTCNSIPGIYEAALKIAQKRQEILSHMRAALETGDNVQALELARNLCGLSDETSNRVN